MQGDNHSVFVRGCLRGGNAFVIAALFARLEDEGIRRPMLRSKRPSIRVDAFDGHLQGLPDATDEEATAIEVADGRLDVRSVSSLDEALAVLEEFGGSGLPPVGG